MKETVNVSIASQAFVLDKDACETLSCYLDEIRRRLPREDSDTMDDIETRIAEIFRERISSPMQVITLDTVRKTMAQLGTPDDFGEITQETSRTETAAEEKPDAPHRLYRSRSDRAIAGVCGGLADYLHIDSTALRILTLFLILFAGLSIWIYLLMWLIIPEEPRTFKLRR